MKLECSRVSSTPLDMRGTFSSFPHFFKGPGAGVTDSPGSITSAIFIPLLTAMPVPPALEAGSEAKNRAFQN
jgi:hypothetical protein